MEKTLNSTWTTAERISFRFFFILFVLFIFFFNNSVLPLFDGISRGVSSGIVPWVSRSFLSLDTVPFRGYGGSGDTTFNYVMLLFVAVMSVVGCLLWSVLDKRKTEYNKLLYWLTVLVRFYIGIMLIHYGVAKLTRTQFVPPDLTRLISPFGDSTPMGLAWTFFGFSDGYNWFMGIIEISCGLLLFRRTTAVGAIIALMISANIMAVNYFFNVPVKIISTALVVMSLFLLAPNIYRFVDFFLKGKAASLRVLEPPVIRKKWMRYSKIAVKCLVIILSIIPTFIYTIKSRNIYGDAAKLPLYGAYQVDSFIPEEPVPKWEKLIIQRAEWSAITLEHNSTEYCKASVDTVKKELKLIFSNEPDSAHVFSYRIPDLQRLELSGVYLGKKLEVKLRKQRFDLMEKRFQWVTENQ